MSDIIICAIALMGWVLFCALFGFFASGGVLWLEIYLADNPADSVKGSFEEKPPASGRWR